jgi:cytochrome c-type biogenesis protein CcmH/NrfG
MMTPTPQLSSEITKQLVDNQTKELELRQREIVISKESNERQFDFANKQIEAQERDRKDERRYHEKCFNHALVAALCIIVVICLFFGYCLALGKDQIVVELFKVLCYGGSFGAGGFAWGRSKGKSLSRN